jgi:hypothetical protein
VSGKFLFLSAASTNFFSCSSAAKSGGQWRIGASLGGGHSSLRPTEPIRSRRQTHADGMPFRKRSFPVGQLNQIKLRIEEKIKADGLNATDVKGKIALKSGKLLAFINEGTPDDPAAIQKLRQAAKEILNINL